ncbi:MAG TPA: 4Fe-4S dicluster-binding protein [bacterium]|nr:4Fe-4S dicluster-binding protein [bacterium]
MKNWKELPIRALIVEPGNSVQYNTGTWRTYKPEIDFNKCIQCLQCWIYCPDTSILVKDEKMSGFDYDHCKGCGICAAVCPVKCITMVKEEK